MMYEGYPFIFQMNDRSCSDNLLEYTMQYRFKSAISDKVFEHFRTDHLSLYVLVNKSYVKDMSDYVNRINAYVERAMFE